MHLSLDNNQRNPKAGRQAACRPATFKPLRSHFTCDVSAIERLPTCPRLRVQYWQHADAQHCKQRHVSVVSIIRILPLPRSVHRRCRCCSRLDRQRTCCSVCCCFIALGVCARRWASLEGWQQERGRAAAVVDGRPHRYAWLRPQKQSRSAVCATKHGGAVMRVL